MPRRPSRTKVRPRGSDRACACETFQCSQGVYRSPLQPGRKNLGVAVQGSGGLRSKCLEACRSTGAAIPSQNLTIIRSLFRIYLRCPASNSVTASATRRRPS
jgi:hypothetical protein